MSFHFQKLLERCKETEENIALHTTLSDSLIEYLDDRCGDSCDVIKGRNDVTRRYMSTCSKVEARMLEVEQIELKETKIEDVFNTFQQGKLNIKSIV